MNDDRQRPPENAGGTAKRIREALERSVKAISLRPSIGLGTGVSRARLVRGLAVEITEGPWKLSSDMPEGAGGEASAPTPGVYGRAALGSCLAMGYAMEAAKAGIAIDYDDGALFGISAHPPGYLEVRIAVTIATSAPEEAVRQVIDKAEAHSPYLDIFRRAQSCSRTLQIVPAAEEQ
jgi:uncharacterized OsmC-like protein